MTLFQQNQRISQTLSRMVDREDKILQAQLSQKLKDMLQITDKHKQTEDFVLALITLATEPVLTLDALVQKFSSAAVPIKEIITLLSDVESFYLFFTVAYHHLALQNADTIFFLEDEKMLDEVLRDHLPEVFAGDLTIKGLIIMCLIRIILESQLYNPIMDFLELKDCAKHSQFEMNCAIQLIAVLKDLLKFDDGKLQSVLKHVSHNTPLTPVSNYSFSQHFLSTLMPLLKGSLVLAVLSGLCIMVGWISSSALIVIAIGFYSIFAVKFFYDRMTK